ncbi:MAG: flagellin [Alphaproteobacteria bacterium]|jgi:flagellar hook-associated protein 3 FlgL|nr:flagellin [Alphaproteobacteria bacterium]MCB1550853.1 flagellin [Alphaproteobacteria bacterium]MCB9984097.1 flagellin [Micavibrio sp.]HRK96946.1 flagellin [Alphaproteobacteria bacterium]
MVNRVATYPYTTSMIADNMRLQVKYADINTQISSGLKSQNYKGISRDTQYLLSVESAVDRLDAYNTNGNIVLATVNTIYEALGQVENMANSVLAAITAALGGGQVPTAVTTAQAQNALNETASVLNLQIASRYVFAGSDIDTPPVDLTDPAWVPQTSPSVVNSNYYQGNSSVLSVQLSESYSVSYGVKADSSAFEELLRAYNLVVNNPGSTAELSEASGLIQQAIDNLATIRSNLSINSRSIEDQINQNEQDKVYLKELVSTIKEVDLPSASVQLTEVQTQMEASYTASVRILNLNLHDYLR